MLGQVVVTLGPCLSDLMERENNITKDMCQRLGEKKMGSFLKEATREKDF